MNVKFFLHWVMCIVLLLCLASLGTEHLRAQSPSLPDTLNSRYDTSRLPIKADALKKKLSAAAKSPITLYQLLRRAQKQKLLNVAFRHLKMLRAQQPRNAVIAAGYALAIDLSRGDYSDSKSSEPFMLTADDIASREKAIKDAYRLDPALWLTYAVDGHFQVVQNEIERGTKLLRKAVELAPTVSFPQYHLAWAYSARDSDPEIFQRVVAGYKKAQTLKPVLVNAPWLLFTIYDLQKPDAKKAADAARLFIAALPPGTLVGPKTRKRLAKYGVAVPWN